MEIGERIKARREELNMTLDELAQKTGYRSRSSLSKIEKGGHDVPRSKIALLAKALETTPSYLMGWEDLESGEPVKEKCGGRIKFFRELRKYSQAEFAHKVGISREQLDDYEQDNSQPGSVLLARMLEVLQVPEMDFAVCGIVSKESTAYREMKKENARKMKEKIISDLDKLNSDGLERVQQIIEDYLKINDYLADDEE